MNKTEKGRVSRRRLLNWVALLSTAVALPARAWAAVTRPDTAFRRDSARSGADGTG